MKLAIFALLGCSLGAQQTATVTLAGIPVSVAPPGTAPGELRLTYSQQGAAELTLKGKKIKGEADVNISVCSYGLTIINLPLLAVKQWAVPFTSFSWINAASSAQVVQQSTLKNIYQLLLDGSTDLPSVGTGLIATKIWHGNTTWAYALSAAQVVFAIAKPRLAERAPNPMLLKAAEAPAALSLNDKQCMEGTALVRYHGDLPPLSLVCSAAGVCRKL